jgi:putative endonuclease
MDNAWHVYILQCADATLYTGIARDLQRRLLQHNGECVGGPKYTRGRRPVLLLWSAKVPDRGAAQQREAAIKKLRRSEKLRLIDGGNRNSCVFKESQKEHRVGHKHITDL